MAEGIVFYDLSVHISGEGVPHPADGGYPILPNGGRGYPISGQDGGAPVQVRSQVRMWGGGYPQPEQHSMYLLYGGRYASCVHTGLSCIVRT